MEKRIIKDINNLLTQLFQKMKEAGYEWDADKKELKIEYPDNLPKDNWELVHEFVNKFGRIPEDEDELNVLIEYVLKRQKPAWSEEDNKIIEEIINDIECARAINYHAPKEGYEFRENWLKSLKDRVLPQPKQEWSEEGEEMLNNAIRSAKINGQIPTVEWLKSLSSQKQWKPSEEQLTELRCVISGCSYETSVLVELEKQLKSLL